MEEIIDAVMYEIENSGFMDRLAAGIVLTGGGAMLKHLPQLVKFKTGMDVRIGFLNERLVADVKEESSQPMYSTSIGLLLKGYDYLLEHNERTGVASKEDATAAEVIAKSREKKFLSGGKIFESLKNAITDIFEEDDTTM